MGFFSTSKKVFGHIFNFKVTDWVNSEQHKINVKYIIDGYKKLFKSKKKHHTKETFEQSMHRLNLTEKDLLARKREFSRLFMISLMFSCAIFIYTMFITVKYQTFYGFLLGLSVTFLSLVNVFKYHFWFKQIELRKLNLTFKEWLNNA